MSQEQIKKTNLKLKEAFEKHKSTILLGTLILQDPDFGSEILKEMFKRRESSSIETKTQYEEALDHASK